MPRFKQRVTAERGIVAPEITELYIRTPGARQFYEYLVSFPTAAYKSSEWDFQGSVYRGWRQISLVTVFGIFFPLPPLPRTQPGAEVYLVEVDIYIKPSGHSNMPEHKPSFTLFAASPIGLLPHQTWEDPSSNIGAYNVAHQIYGVLDDSFLLDWTPSPAFYIAINGEYGVNAQTDLELIGFKVVVSPTAL